MGHFWGSSIPHWLHSDATAYLNIVADHVDIRTMYVLWYSSARYFVELSFSTLEVCTPASYGFVEALSPNNWSLSPVTIFIIDSSRLIFTTLLSSQ